MFKPRSFVVVHAAVLALVAVSGSPAYGAPVLFDFSVTFTEGDLDGNSYAGTFSVDGDDCTAPGGLCDGVFDPDGPLALLSFDITIAGVSYEIDDDTRGPGFPFVAFDNNVVTAISYQAVIPGGHLDISFDDETNRVTFFVPGPQGGQRSSGSVDQVPEPATVLLLALGVGAIVARREFRVRK